MKTKIGIGVILFLAFISVSFAADYPKATGHVNDIAQCLPEFMVENLGIFAASYSQNQHLNFVILCMDPPDPDEAFPAAAEPESYAKKVIDFWGDDGQRETDRGTVLVIFYTRNRAPEVEANGALQSLVTSDLRERIKSAVAKPMHDNVLPQVVICGLNSIVDTFMDTSHEMNQI